MDNVKYTLVQHSGFVVGGKLSFENAVELRSLYSFEARQVEEAGGLLFETYSEASEAELRENYPPEVPGLIPRVSGGFSNKKVQGQAIYIPPAYRDTK